MDNLPIRQCLSLKADLTPLATREVATRETVFGAALSGRIQSNFPQFENAGEVWQRLEINTNFFETFVF